MYGITEFIIKVRKQDRKDNYLLPNGVELFIPTQFRGAKMAPITGEVISLPRKPFKGVEHISVGDTILYHYNTAREDQFLDDAEKAENANNKISEYAFENREEIQAEDYRIYYVEHDNVYGVIKNGTIYPIGDRCLCEEIIDVGKQTESGIWLGEDKPREQRLRVCYVGDNGYGIEVGDEIIYPAGTNHLLSFFRDGKEVSLFNIQLNLVIGKIDNEEVKPVGIFSHISRSAEVEKIGSIFIPQSERHKFQPKTGTITALAPILEDQTISVGDFCNFFPVEQFSFTHNGHKIYAVEEDKILWVQEK